MGVQATPFVIVELVLCCVAMVNIPVNNEDAGDKSAEYSSTNHITAHTYHMTRLGPAPALALS